MKNYTILKTEIPNIFTIQDETPWNINIVRGEDVALLPQLIAMLNDIADNGGDTDGVSLEIFLGKNNLRKK